MVVNILLCLGNFSFNTRGYIFLRLWDIIVHARFDGNLKTLVIKKCIARDLKIKFLYNMSYGILDLNIFI